MKVLNNSEKYFKRFDFSENYNCMTDLKKIHFLARIQTRRF